MNRTMLFPLLTTSRGLLSVHVVPVACFVDHSVLSTLSDYQVDIILSGLNYLIILRNDKEHVGGIEIVARD